MGKAAFKIFLGIFVILVAVLGGWGAIQYYEWNRPWNEGIEPFMIEVPEGKSARWIGEQLKEKGIISNTDLFLVIADLRGIGDKLKAGEYEIKGTYTPYEVLDLLARGEAYRRALVIPEGYTQVQIAEACEKLEICTKAEFLEECRLNDIFAFVVSQAPNNANAACEGILYPDTYYFIRNTPAERVFHRMLRHFESVWMELMALDEVENTPDLWWKDETKADLMQQHNVIVLASIIEREAKTDEDRPLIASVLVNRLQKDMPLQADCTIRYALSDWTQPLTLSDLEIDSPYNTYKHKGLPPAAICNPGKASLRAALLPPKTDYFYYQANDKGETFFHQTHEEHVNLKNQIKRERRDAAAAAKN